MADKDFNTEYEAIIKELYKKHIVKSGVYIVNEIYTYITQNKWVPRNIIQVAGTCGKTSVSTKIAAVLKESTEENVGLFISPHVLDCRERIQINGKPILKEDFIHLYGHIKECIDKHKLNPSMFDILTVMALLYFQQGPLSQCYKRSVLKHKTRVANYADFRSINKNCKNRFDFINSLKLPENFSISRSKNSPIGGKGTKQIESSNIRSNVRNKTLPAIFYGRQDAYCHYIVLETGMGGRLDPTNTFSNTVLSVITSIGFDHQKYLGNTLEEIAYEKAGIIKFNVPLVVGPSVLKYKSVQAEIKRGKPKNVFSISEPPMATSFNVINSIIASTAVDVLLGPDWKIKHFSAINLDPIYRFHELPETQVQHVIEKFLGEPNLQLPLKIIIDVGHNVLAAKLVAEYLSNLYYSYQIYILFGLTGDRNFDILKPFAEALAIQLQGFNYFYSTNPKVKKFEDIKFHLDPENNDEHDIRLKELYDEMIAEHIIFPVTGNKEVLRTTKLKQLFKKIYENNGGEDCLLLIFGSVYIVEEIISEFEINNN